MLKKDMESTVVGAFLFLVNCGKNEDLLKK